MIKILYIFTSCRKSGPIQQMLNLIKNLDRTKYTPFLVTLYPENENGLSVLEQYLPFVEYQHIPVGKIGAMFLPCRKLKKFIFEYAPDVIHTLGVFPDYLITRLGYWNHTFTCRNFLYDDYPDEYGRVMGTLLAKIHLKAIKKTKYVRVCSESLHNIYTARMSLDIPFIRNGVDISKYTVPSPEKKAKLRKTFGIEPDQKVWVYAGVYNGRKNQAFLLDAIVDSKHFGESVFLLPGDGEMLPELRKAYEKYKNIIMPGNVLNMPEYLSASDLYMSTSKSEGMPNGVLEAMASGLPVLLSDIDQHNEILGAAEGFGLSYRRDDRDDFIRKVDFLFENVDEAMGQTASKVAERHFSAKRMSENYQALYEMIVLEEHNG